MQDLDPAIVLETKLHPPPSRRGVIERAGLLRRLLEADASLVVVGAPAGYGKTMLLAQYAGVADRPVAWPSLDGADADPVLLALELAAVVDRVAPLDARVFASLTSPAPAIQRVVLPGLINGLDAGGEVALVLDDLHLVEGPASLAVLSFLCEHLPPRAQLLVASRDTSALPLGGLRVGGRLLELGWRDLALSRPEAEGVLRAAGAPAEEDLDAVLEQTEGWPAAVYLAALALRDGNRRGAALRGPATIAIWSTTCPASCSRACSWPRSRSVASTAWWPSWAPPVSRVVVEARGPGPPRIAHRKPRGAMLSSLGGSSGAGPARSMSSTRKGSPGGGAQAASSAGAASRRATCIATA